MIEVEFRGPLSEADHKRVSAYLEEKGAAKKFQDRIFIDYSEPMATRTKDVRIRCTNGISEIMIKLGKTGGEDARREFGAKAGEHKFDDLVGVMHALGYDQGPLCHFQSDIFKYGEFEVVLKVVPGHPERGLFEAEIEVTNDAEVPAARVRLTEFLTTLGLTPFADVDYVSYVNGLMEVFPMFDYASYEPGYFAKIFSI